MFEIKKIFLTFFLFFFFSLNNVYSFTTKAKQAILIDYDTGQILFKKNANDRVQPSSMTKIMTAYLVFEKIKENKISLTDKIKVSDEASKQIGSKMFINYGSSVSVEDLLKGLIVQSGNDSAFALAEGISGSVDEFVKIMNLKAEEMKLTNTNFTNPIGFTDSTHYMSVRDTAFLSKYLIEDYFDYYKEYFSIKEYKYNNILQQNRNELLSSYEGVDGVKTGHTEIGGYAISVSAVKNGRRLISVVNGLDKINERVEETRNLLNYGFLTLSKFDFYKKNEPIKKVNILYGKTKKINLISNVDVSAIGLIKEDIKIEFDIPKKIKAPIFKNQKIGSLKLITDEDILTYDLFSLEEVKKSNIFIRLFQFISYLFTGTFK